MEIRFPSVRGMDPVQQIVKAIEAMRASIPINIDLWSTKEIAAYLKRNERTVRTGVVTLPGFPQAIRLPAATGTRGNGHPLWKAREVIAWVERHQEQRAA